MQTRIIIRSLQASVVCVSILVLLAADGPATHSAAVAGSAEEAARTARGTVIRSILLDTLEEAYAHDGEWPAALVKSASISDPHLIYIRPEKHEEVGYWSHQRSSTVVVRELTDADHGTWVGYADGHLEYAADAASLGDCMNQLPMVQEAIKAESAANAATQPGVVQPSTQPTGALKIRLLDPDGKPVIGATVGVFGTFGDFLPQLKLCRFWGKPESLTSDAAGETTVPAASAFGAKFYDQPTVPLWIIHNARGLCAMPLVQRSDFTEGKVRIIQLHKGCKINGHVTCLGRSADHPNAATFVSIARPGEDRYYTLVLAFKEPRFNAILPPGDYSLDAYSDTKSAIRFVHIDPDRQEIDLNLDLPPNTIDAMIGHPAPELRDIKAWKNGGPVTLASLHGKVVVLDFWEYGCGPCCGQMPDLMMLHDKFKDKGLVIIAVHSDCVASVAEMDQKLEKTRKKMWAGRDLPFLVALDGGGSHRIACTSKYADGSTTALYGISSFPTTLIIDKEGNLVGNLEYEPTKAAEQIQKLLAP